MTSLVQLLLQRYPQLLPDEQQHQGDVLKSLRQVTRKLERMKKTFSVTFFHYIMNEIEHGQDVWFTLEISPTVMIAIYVIASSHRGQRYRYIFEMFCIDYITDDAHHMDMKTCIFRDEGHSRTTFQKKLHFLLSVVPCPLHIYELSIQRHIPIKKWKTCQAFSHAHDFHIRMDFLHMLQSRASPQPSLLSVFLNHDKHDIHDLQQKMQEYCQRHSLPHCRTIITPFFTMVNFPRQIHSLDVVQQEYKRRRRDRLSVF